MLRAGEVDDPPLLVVQAMLGSKLGFRVVWGIVKG